MVLFRAIGYPFMPKQGSTAKYKAAKFKIWQGRVPKSPNAKLKNAKYKIITVFQNLREDIVFGEGREQESMFTYKLTVRYNKLHFP